MNNFSFWKYADAPYDMISREFASNKAFQKTSKKVLIIAWIVGIFFLTTVIMFFIAIFFLFFILTAQKNSKHKSLLLYWIDYAIMKQLEKTWKIHLSEDFKFRLLTREFIQDDFSVHLKQNSNIQKDSQKKDTQTNSTFSNERVKFDKRKFETSNHTQTKTWEKTKTSDKRSSVFDSYVSVRESFKKIKNR